MMKTFLYIFISIHIFFGLKAFAYSERIELKTGSAQLIIDKKNHLNIIQNNKEIRITTPISKLGEIIIENKNSGAKLTLETGGDELSISKKDGIISIKSNSFAINNMDIPLKVEFTITVKEDAFCFAGSLEIPSEEWVIAELKYPNLSGIQFKNETGIYWPDGLGKYFDNPDTFGKKSLEYPSTWATMPWFSINSKESGLYVGSHDPLQETKNFSLEYDKTEKKFNTQIGTAVYDTEYLIPDIMIKPYSGAWRSATKFYRKWYDSHFKIITPPDWVKDDSGWLLAIFKQQNMEIMWSYKDIDKLCDIAERFNLSTIGLFGWTVGGHDHLYPYYLPDNLMGGRRELELAIERAHKRGIRIIIYSNGKIMDTSTDFYKYNGYEAMLLQENLQPLIQYHIKQKKSTPVIFAQACTGSGVWRRTMHDLCLQAVSLGADGILYDQLGVIRANLCFSENHDHKPGKTDPMYRLQMVNQAREKAREINPDFIVMTEAVNDYISKGIDYTHGWGASYQVSQNGFPALFRYTFPELITTQRNPNPIITRTDANYAAIYGLRHEIESRYPGDVDYLLNSTLPGKESYTNVVRPPDIEKMNLEPADKATRYVHSLIEFEKRNAEFFRRGEFIDEEGIEVTGSDILAKGFSNGNNLGVVIWNQNLNETENFSVSVPGYRFVKSSKPDTQDEFKPVTQLEANSICIHVYEKQ